METVAAFVVKAVAVMVVVKVGVGAVIRDVDNVGSALSS